MDAPPARLRLSVAVAVGFIALAGLAVEFGVMMVTYLRLALAERATLAEREGRALDAQASASPCSTAPPDAYAPSP